MFRVLLAIRVNFFGIVTAVKQNRYKGLIAPHVGEDKAAIVRPWRADEAVMMAMLDVVVAGVSYLL